MIIYFLDVIKIHINLNMIFKIKQMIKNNLKLLKKYKDKIIPISIKIKIKLVINKNLRLLLVN